MEYVHSNPEDRVVAAVGYGRGMEAKLRERKLLRERRRRRNRQRAILIGCGVVIIGALFIYGRYKIVGMNAAPDVPEDVEKRAPQVRKLRADPSSEDNSKGAKPSGSTTIRETTDASSLRPNIVTQKPLGEVTSLSLMPSKLKSC